MKKYSGDRLAKISFPLGGIGTGCIGLTGTGRLGEWEIFGRPAKETFNGCSHFAVRAEADGEVLDARLLAGAFAGDRTGSPGNLGFGVPREAMAGAPTFAECRFEAEFPFATIVLNDPNFPGTARLTAFNPFIPLNEFDSSLPGAVFHVEIENPTPRAIRYTIALTADNPWKALSENRFSDDGNLRRMTLRDVRPEGEALLDYGEIVLATDAADTSFQENWFKGSWFDGLSVFFRELRAPGPFAPRSFGVDGDSTLPGGIADTHKHATLAAHIDAPPGGTARARFVVAWRVPNAGNYWDKELDPAELERLGLENRWRHHYATRFASAGAATEYLFAHRERLEAESRRFARAFHGQSLPETFIDAASACLSVLKSPTCLRLEDGSFYAFEGCGKDFGCCEGSCTHVWNYAAALPFLFPDLERSMRVLEYRHNLLPDGEMPMRLMLPLGRPSKYRACADGQFGTIIKVYREWKLCGDDAWMKTLWPGVRRSLEYAWHPDNTQRWDPDRTGLLGGRQHHTLDMELFGANAWLAGFYVAALSAAAEMADAAGELDFADECRALHARGRRRIHNELFNGEYFAQKVDLADHETLRPYAADRGCADRTRKTTVYESYWDGAHGEIKYQVGEGCLADQLLAQWHTALAGLPPVFGEAEAVSALRAVFRHNFRRDMGTVFNPCRVYSTAGEAGTMICSWPEGRRKPWVPLTYAEETMPGFEYALAGQMVHHGLLAEAEAVVGAVRARHNGANRNPWNEMECGSNYARSLAAYALVPLSLGFRCDATRGELAFAPVGDPKTVRGFWSTAAAWGTYARDGDRAALSVLYGTLGLRRLVLPGFAVRTARVAERPEAFRREGDALVFEAEPAPRLAAGSVLVLSAAAGHDLSPKSCTCTDRELAGSPL